MASLLAGCGRQASQSAEAPAPPPTSVESVLPARSGFLERFVLTGAAGETRLTVWRQTGRIRLEQTTGGEPLRITGHDHGRERRYQNPRVSVLKVRERRPGELQFLEPTGKVAWIARVSPSQVRLVRGDRSGAADFIAMRRHGFVTARHAATSRGSIVPVPEKQRLRARDGAGQFQLEAPADLPPLALAALLLTDLPPEHRLVLFAELLRW